VEAGRLLANTRCSNVKVLDASGISPVTDFLVLATGTSPRQMKGAADEVEEMAAGCGYGLLSRVGDASSQWIVADYVDVVVHIFSADARAFYDLDNLWGDARRVELPPQPAPHGNRV
jgi:ribosome-associated protein